ncbi:hypothetical protein [Streptomyces sp. SID12501]|uniref:Uncharacterized protein n=1 Tax=Streptomyces sp. SID12501 TaxID=2706042 RepID=A0A6B3BQS1_9ACTN|nr:hypothetical protein [Streptomyces sp. SID12501]NEC86691.1 hypothetical protein [Streptomyces sp. SID12501]
MTDTNTDTDLNSNANSAQSDGCWGCQELDRTEAAARAERDASKVSDCRVLRTRHRVAEHGERS